MHTDSIVAIISLLLYSILAGVSAAYYFKFRTILRIVNSGDSQHDIGKYDEPKVLFFLVLFVSTLLEMPQFLGCLTMKDHKECTWKGNSYLICLSLSTLASCGYLFTIITPPVMWSDIISQKDGKLWFSKFPMDSTKRFFQISLISFSILVLLTIISEFRLFDHKHHHRSRLFAAILDVVLALRALMILVIIGGGVYCGFRLQYYVVGVKIGEYQKQFLAQLNFTMMFILGAYVTRAMYLLNVWDDLKSPYYVKVFFGFWLPRIFCSFCLINEMKYSSIQTTSGKYTSVDSVFNTLSLLKEGSYQSLRYSDDMMAGKIDEIRSSDLQQTLIRDETFM